MNFLERERGRLVKARDELFRDPGLGLFAGRPREFVLTDPAANLWEGIRADALDYFQRNEIPWWRGANNEPTGHLLSSQIACVNHLFSLRQRPDLATSVLHAFDEEIIAAETVDDGFVEFEFIGAKQYLKERSFSRGSHCTSVDAFMIGRTQNGSRRAFLIEWKYTELYRRRNDYIPARAKVYDNLITANDSPFLPVNRGGLYFEPFYQLMRQTLLGWQLALNADHGCTSYRHIHVVPDENDEFHYNVTAPLAGNSVSEAWRNVLKRPELYQGVSPQAFMRPVVDGRDTKALSRYLALRYWAAR